MATPSNDSSSDYSEPKYADLIARGDPPTDPGLDLSEEQRKRYDQERAFIGILGKVFHDAAPLPRDSSARPEPPTDETRPLDSDTIFQGDTVAGGGADGSRSRGAAIMFQPPGYRVLEKRGQGGMGVVYRAIETKLNRLVAIKVLSTTDEPTERRIARSQQEVQVAASLVSTGIPQVLNAFSFGGCPVMVMSYIDGLNLDEIDKARGAFAAGPIDPEKASHPLVTLPEDEYVRAILLVLDRVIETIAAVHREKVIHRDIKPSNVMVDRHGGVWVTDFGLARRFDEESTLTATNAQLGSKGYMSPEQWEQRRDLDARVDVFGLGALIYNLLTHKLPYGTVPLSSRMGPPPPPSRFARLPNEYFDTLLIDALAPNREDRFRSAVELETAWKRVRNNLPNPHRPSPSWWQRLKRRVRDHQWGWMDAALGSAMCLALFLGLFNRPSQNLSPVSSRTVQIDTFPSRARIVLVPIDPTTGDPDGRRAIRPPTGRTTPLTISGVAPGDYLVVAAVPGTRDFHEVLRHVPAPGETPQRFSYRGLKNWSSFPHLSWTEQRGVVLLPRVVIPQNVDCSTMAPFSGHPKFSIGHPDPQVGLVAHDVAVAPFLLDATEVSGGQFAELMGGLPEELLSEAEPYDPRRPVVFVTYDHAVAYAERVGKRLPTEEEFEFAVTNGGTREFPWGDSNERLRDGPRWTWYFGRVGEADPLDRIETNPPVLGLFSNVAEWTGSHLKPYPTGIPGLAPVRLSGFEERRAVRGGTWGVMQGGRPEDSLTDRLMTPRFRVGQFAREGLAGVGFRCARSIGPRFLDTR